MRLSFFWAREKVSWVSLFFNQCESPMRLSLFRILVKVLVLFPIRVKALMRLFSTKVEVPWGCLISIKFKALSIMLSFLKLERKSHKSPFFQQIESSSKKPGNFYLLRLKVHETAPFLLLWKSHDAALFFVRLKVPWDCPFFQAEWKSHDAVLLFF